MSNEAPGPDERPGPPGGGAGPIMIGFALVTLVLLVLGWLSQP